MRLFTFAKKVFISSMIIGLACVIVSFVLIILRPRRHPNSVTSQPSRGSRSEGVVESVVQSKAQRKNATVDSIWPMRSRNKLCLFNNFGKLGNQIYEYASAYGLALNKRLEPIVDNAVYNLLDKSFNLTLPADLRVDAKVHCKSNSFISIRGVATAKLARDVIDVITTPVQSDYKFQGFHQSWMYFYNYQDEVRRELTFRDDLLKEARQVIKDASKDLVSQYPTNDDVIYVGVHLRRNLDFKGYKEYGIIMAPGEYYRRAMRYFMDKYDNVVFIVCSNGIKFAKEHLKSFPAAFIEPLSDRPELDLCILSLCDHSIISAGTYSFWSAFLANGETIYFKTPFAIGSRYAEKYSRHLTDYYPPYWIPME